MAADTRRQAQASLPPGQVVAQDWGALHYGPVPTFRPQRWDLRIHGSTGDGDVRLSWDDVDSLPRVGLVADFHCVTRLTVPAVDWSGVSVATIVDLCPPDGEATHVMVWGEYGYSANLRMVDFLADTTLLATHRGAHRLEPEHGHPLRLVVPHLYGYKSVKWVREIEYLRADRRGFWEERGYHNRADPWSEQRYAYQEEPSEPPSAREP
ncbi:molybdopterin-dependent oxidoreductase [Spiractinospora alimapuensis]|uniref:molybdopterin-dependent oxidoreductase n=1 Tax=Spiractinospora alimapuensis TaxID=2820884 RepID=UPI001F4234DB|nr:molybdopterin-dependent oxidoreductase [Spiractinospora alimapuensis]QVQ53221.1 molybdopterin-dependent oxidoreductase [Spiractinospora alimapuensis]